MGRYSTDTGGGEFQHAPAGTHIARCIRLIDLGTQHSSYQGQPTIRNQVLVTWELPNEPMSDGKPFTVSNFYTNSLNEKATLRHHLAGWRGRDFTDEEAKKFDLMAVLGKPCMLSVIHNDKGKARISSVSALPKGTTVPPQVNASSSFWIEEWDQKAYEAIPQGIRKIIEQSDEYKARTNGNGAAKGGHFDDMADDIPWDDNAPADDRDQPPF